MYSYLDSIRLGRDHEIIEPFQNCVIITAGVAVTDLGRFEVREWVDVRAL